MRDVKPPVSCHRGFCVVLEVPLSDQVPQLPDADRANSANCREYFKHGNHKKTFARIRLIRAIRVPNFVELATVIRTNATPSACGVPDAASAAVVFGSHGTHPDP